MYRRILVAFDGSHGSHMALGHALALAREQHASVRVVHAIESLHYLVSLSGGYPFDAGGLIESLRQEGTWVLNAAKDKAQSAGVAVETALLEGTNPTERIAHLLLREARRWDADLVVLGTHGRRGLDRLMLGSVAEALVRAATVPVLLVRTG